MEPALSSDDSCDSEMKLMKTELIGNNNAFMYKTTSYF